MNPLLMEEVTRKADALNREAEPYAMALVVRCESPTSAKPGARGLVTRDGAITGWIGGGCAQPIVIEESLASLREGTSRLVRITPQAGSAEVNGVRIYEMVCHSGGTMDIFIEPVLPLPVVVILGRSPVARTLTRLAGTMGYRVSVFAQGAEAADFEGVERLETSFSALADSPRPADCFIVVSTQGEDDEGGLEAALGLEASYIGFVASPKKWKAVRETLSARGVSPEQLERVRAPAGVEIGAVEPEEIALSVMAQIVATRRGPGHSGAAKGQQAAARESAGGAAGQEKGAAEAPSKAIDPICNMTVNIATASHTSQYKEQTVYFCCAGCKTKFDRNPEQYTLPG
ncbi:MAG: XdhC family protein [SAR324 cluster bacterium]|nr:XdhC family protein [SAR324 cluster bacterium]